MTARPDPYLADVAAAELASRRARYPRLVEEGRKDREEAAADVAAWTAIEALLRTGGCDAADLEAIAGDAAMPSACWALLEAAAGAALAALEEAVRACPEQGRGNEALRARRDAVAAIHRRMAWQLELATMRPTGEGRVAA